MNHSGDSYQDDLDELLSQVDELLLGKEPEPEEADFDVEDYAPVDDSDDDLMVFQNYSNGYGTQIRNFSNGYGAGSPAEAEEDPPVQPAIPAYNADFRQPVRKQAKQIYEPEPELPVPEKPKKEKKAKKKKRGCGCLPMLLLLALIVGLALSWVFDAPESEHSIGRRKRDTATVLICGTDWEGARTDTMMLLYLSGSEHRVSLVSLPRDTLTVTSRGNYAKLNSAYGRNGSGKEGMEGLLDYVQEIIGYRPDGYMLIDMELVPKIVDVMGGVDVEVPMSFELEGEHLEKGMQHLTGNQVLQLLRYREGYAMQDLDRVKVQRSVISACLDQWFTLEHLKDVGAALELVENNSLTTLNVRNYLWMAKTVLLSLGDISTETLPGYADYIHGASYYILNRQGVADLINRTCNPYREEIPADSLKIVG